MSKDTSKQLEELRLFIEDAVKAGHFSDEAAAIARALELLREDTTGTASKQRRGGQWKGQVTIAPDFDDLPDDIAESFGVQ